MIDCRECKGTGKVPDDRYFRCDTAIAHGPGHQSISPCQVVGPHTEHQASGYEWTEAALSSQTWDKKKYERVPGKQISVPVGVEKTYRLTFSRDIF